MKMNEHKETADEAQERRQREREEQEARDNHWKTLANEYLKLVSATEFFANVILENNEQLSEIAWRDGYSNAYEWVEWVYDPDKDYEGE